ncbi:Ribosomal protein L9 and Ubiquitin interacting motif domain containing protein [Aphelenchoides fujianensis]|nr:Ribosomal protein L9 and Ubiquitin interacting motif domain containing protein [Aphelenchoides fujianensis]
MDRESVMICIDNSEWVRSGTPTQLQSQQDAVNLVMQCKLRANPENGVGLVSMADDVEVLSSISREERKLFIRLHELEIKGSAHLLTAIKIAHLALRHRPNRNHKMRIIMFVGSPLEKLDKATDNQVLADFVDTLNGKDNNTSSLLVVSEGSKLIEALVSSAICRGEGGNMAMIGQNGAVEFGIDPEEDPELALALRVSLEEQRQRQRQENQQEGNQVGEQPMDAQPAQNGGAPAAQKEAAGAQEAAEVDLAQMSEQEQLEWALRMSVADTVGGNDEKPAAGQSTSAKNEEAMEVDEGVGKLIDNPELLQQMVDNIGGNKDEKEADKKGKDDDATSSGGNDKK